LIFDVFVVSNDPKLDEYNLFNNLWYETLLMHSIDDSRIAPVTDFG